MRLLGGRSGRCPVGLKDGRSAHMQIATQAGRCGPSVGRFGPHSGRCWPTSGLNLSKVGRRKRTDEHRPNTHVDKTSAVADATARVVITAPRSGRFGREKVTRALSKCCSTQVPKSYPRRSPIPATSGVPPKFAEHLPQHCRKVTPRTESRSRCKQHWFWGPNFEQLWSTWAIRTICSVWGLILGRVGRKLCGPKPAQCQGRNWSELAHIHHVLANSTECGRKSGKVGPTWQARAKSWLVSAKLWSES